MTMYGNSERQIELLLSQISDCLSTMLTELRAFRCVVQAHEGLEPLPLNSCVPGVGSPYLAVPAVAPTVRDMMSALDPHGTFVLDKKTNGLWELLDLTQSDSDPYVLGYQSPDLGSVTAAVNYMNSLRK